MNYTHYTGQFFVLKEFQHIFHLNTILLNCFDYNRVYSDLKMLKQCNIRLDISELCEGNLKMQNALGKFSPNVYSFIVEIQKHLKIWINKF